MDTIYEMAVILVFFPKYAVYFKLHYFKLIHLQANLLSLFISTFFLQSIILISLKIVI